MPRGRHAPPLEVRQDRQRARLFAAAAAVFARVGYADATAEAIAREAGMSKATFYEHFANKEECIIALFDAAVQTLLHNMREAVARHADADPTTRVLSRAAAAHLSADLRARHLPRRRRPLQRDDVVLRAGAVVGALVVAWLGRFKHMGLTLLLVQLAFGGLVTAFALSRTLWLSYLLLFLDGAALLVVFSMTASLVQLIVPDHLRGRVVSIYMVAFRGGMPLGSLWGGYAASLSSAPYVLADQRRAGDGGGAVFPGPESRGQRAVNLPRTAACSTAPAGARRALRPHDDTTTRRDDETFVSLFDGLVPAGGHRASRGGRSEGRGGSQVATANIPATCDPPRPSLLHAGRSAGVAANGESR